VPHHIGNCRDTLTAMRLLIPTLAAAILFVATPARAEGSTGFFGIGPQFAIAFCCDDKNTYGVGVEASYSRMRWNYSESSTPGKEPSQFPGSYVGGFAVWQVFFPSSRGYHRLAAGGQAGWTAFGSELGLAYQSSSPVTNSSAGVQATPYLSAALAWTGFRFTFPGGSSTEGKSRGMRVEWVLGFKLPIRTDGDELQGGDGDGDSDWD